MLTLVRNLNLWKQFIYIHLKDLIMFFQKNVIICSGLSNSSRDIEEQNIKKSSDAAEIWWISSISNAKIF